METSNEPIFQEHHPHQNFMQRNALSIKIALIGVLILLLFIPLSMVKGLIEERSETAQQATYEVQNKWSGIQQITGPYISIPFYENKEETYYEDGNSRVKITKVLNYLYILPETLDISGHIATETLKRGLYEIVVYRTPLKLTGQFVFPPHYNTEKKPEDFLLQNATLNIGITDLRGLSEQVFVEWENQSFQFNPGLPSNNILQSGISTPLDIAQNFQPGDTVNFNISIQLKGSESLLFAPFGKTTTVTMTSNSLTPSFTGAFLPENREVNKQGFTADWKILNLNRNYPQVFTGKQVMSPEDFATFGVDLLLPVEQYQQSIRSVKYASLIIILTFVVNFFAEVIHKKNIHPFQYLLTGLALCLFYTLLVAISEHLGFNIAYFISAVLTIILLTLYMRGVLKIRKTAYTIGGLLTFLYLYIYILIQLETYALLAGSLGLFIILAIIMYYSQKINWNNAEQ